MKFTFQDKAIAGMAVVVPERERLFVEDMKLFNAPENRSRKLAMVMGYHAHRIVDASVCASDLADFGFNRLFESGKLRPDEIDALVYVTLSPDHFMPPTSCIVGKTTISASDRFDIISFRNKGDNSSSQSKKYTHSDLQ